MVVNQTVELLEKCSSGCKMAIHSIDQIEDFVAQDKLKSVIGDYKKRHERLDKEASELLSRYGEDGKEPGKMASAFSWFSTEMKLMFKDDEHEIAKIMTDGCNMGIQSLSKAVNECGEASSESLSLAKSLVRTDEAFMGDLKEFL